MIEGLLANILNKYVGKYVSNLDSSNLNLSIFRGDVELTDLQLRPEALAALDLPVEVKAGYIGHLKIDIPWTQLFSADINVAIENVYVLAGPITDRQYDPEKEKQLQIALKRQLLDRIDQSTIDSVVDQTNENPSFAEKLTTSILNRLQVSVRHIHIRYEDIITNGDHAFACGLMLKQLLVCSTDSHWQPRGADVLPNMMHKMLKLDELSVYWNPYVREHHLLKTRLNTDGWRNLLRISIDSHTIFEEELDFIMEPVAAQARLIINTDNNFTLPKLFTDFTIEEVEILLSRQQLLNLINLKDSFTLMRVNQRYRKYHPNIGIKVSPRSWWVYAYSAIVEEVIRPFSWERIRDHRAKFNKYKSLYKMYLEEPHNKSIKAKLRQCEDDDLDVTNILIAKEQAKLEFAIEAPDRAKKSVKKRKGWFSSWFWGSESEDLLIEVEAENKMDWLSRLTPEEKEKLYAGIGYDDSIRNIAYPKKYVATKIQVILKRCCVSMVNYSKKILQVSVTQLLSTFEHRPENNGFRISCNTESFAVEGASIEHELIPILTSDIGVYAPSVNQVFTLDFEAKPLYMEADYSLSLNVQPVEIVYDEHSISEVTAFFQLPHGGLDIKSAAVKTLTNVADMGRAGLKFIIETHTTVHISLNMRSPYIVIPEYGTLHRGGNVLIIDLGTLRIESELQPKDVSLEDATMSEIESRLYDQFNTKISEVKVLLADSADDWHTAQIQPNSEYHILPSVQLIITFFNAVKPDFTQLPRHKLEAKVPTLEINISDKRLLLLATFLRNFPIPPSSSMATIGEDMPDSHGAANVASFHLDLAEAQLEPDLQELRCIRRSVLGRSLIDKTDDARRSVSKVPTLMYTTGDEPMYSGSDYSDEDLEKLSDMLVIKPVDDNSSVANTINMLMRMSLGELVLNLSKEMDKEEKAYLMIRINRLRIDSALTVHGYSAFATLGGIQLVDKIHVGHSGEYMEVLSTNTVNNNNLASIIYRKVDPVCPDFATYYGGVEHAIKIKVLSLSTLFDQASMMYLNAFLQSIISSVHNLDMKTSSSSIMTTSEMSLKEKVSLKKHLAVITEQGNDVPYIGTRLHLIAELEDFSVRLTDSDNNLAEIKVKGFEGSVIAKSSKLTIRSRLKDLNIRDSSVGAVYQNIMMLQDDSVFDLKLVKYNKKSGLQSKSDTDHGLDYSVRLWLGQIQAVLLGKFYWEITRFFEPFINQEMKETAKQTAVDTVTNQINEFENNSLRVSLNVEVRTPTVLLPHDSKSMDMLLVQLGNLTIRNSFLTVDSGDNVQQEWTDIHINLSHIQVQRVCLNLAEDSTEIIHTLLEPLSFNSEIKVAIKPIIDETKLDISGHLEKVKVNILQKDIQLLLGIIRYNLTESSPPPSPDMYESPTMQNIHGPQMEVQTDLGAMSDAADIHTPDSPPLFMQKTCTKLSLQMEGLMVHLFTNDGKEHSTRTSLCILDVEKISLSGLYRSDGELGIDVSLHSADLSDTRPDSSMAVKRVLECVSKEHAADFPLVSANYKLSSDGNHKAELDVEKLQMNVNTPFVMALISFFNVAMETVYQWYRTDSSLANSSPPVKKPSLGQEELNSSNSTTFIIKGTLKQPEIILYADPTQANSRALLLYSDITFNIRKDATKQDICLRITDMKLISKGSLQSSLCNMVMYPCCVELTQKVDMLSGTSETKASLTKIVTFISPSIMQLFWDVMSSIQGQEAAAKSKTQVSTNDGDIHNLWMVSKVTSEKWLKDRPEASPVPILKPSQLPKESFQLEVKEVNVYFEIETLDKHVPILCLHTSLQTTIEEWSRKMYLTAELHLKMMYFNEKISVWEPIIEPVMERESVYRPWELLIKVIKANSFPMKCMYEDNDVNIPEELQTEVQQMMHRSNVKSSSSETDDPAADQDTKVIRHKSLNRLRHGSDRSFDSSHHSSVQGESDSEPEGFISNMTSKLGSIFSSDSSDADVSETDDNDDGIDMSLDKPVFLTSRGPVHMITGEPSGFDEVDAPKDAEGDGADDAQKCLYVLLNSIDKLQLNVTPQSIKVLKDVIEALTNPVKSELQSVRNMPQFKVNNELGVHTFITCHQKIKVHQDHTKNATVYYSGKDDVVHPADYDNDVVDSGNDQNFRTTLDLTDTFARVGHTLVSAGAFVFNDDDDYLSGNELDCNRLKLQVEGFEQTSSILHRCSCRKLIPLTPLKNGMKYCVVMDIDIWHGCKTINIYSPLKLENHLTMPIDVYCRTEDLKKFKATRGLATSETFSKLTTVRESETYNLPLFVAYHCPLYIKPSEIHHELTSTPLWWQDMLQGKDRVKNFVCMSTQEEKSYNFKAVCKEGDNLRSHASGARTLPYYTIHLYPPVVLHNFLPYDIQFSLQGTTMPSSLIHGEKTPLYTAETGKVYKLFITLPDYMGSDWTGTLEISPDMEEFRAITMETEIDSENINRHLSLGIHADQTHALDLCIYTPYWIINKTDLPLQLRGSLSDAVYDLNNTLNPVLFRFKKHKRKKAKLRVYESRWSQSFSADTVGSGGIVTCNDKERGKKYMFLIQISLSKLRLTKLVTIMPFFLVINTTKQRLRYMEENEKADLWIDIDPDQYQAFWPVTETFNMYVKFDGSNVSSLHFPIKSCHNTVLRMDQGRALCVEVSGGTDTPITIIFSNYEQGDAPVRVENLCEDVFIKIHQKNQSQVTLLSPNQSILYTWDEPSAERTLMWNVYSRKKPSYPAFITKDGSDEVRLSVASLKTAGAPGIEVTDCRETEDSSSPDDESDETDAILASHNRSQLGHTRVDKLLVFWVSYLDGLQRVLLFTQDERVYKAVCKTNEGEKADLAVFASLEGISVSVINSLYQEVALLSITSCPSIWEVEVKDKWRPLNVELATWLEDQWRGQVTEASLQEQIEADLQKMQMTKPFIGALRRTFRSGIWCQYQSSKHHMTVNMRMQTVQVDNQLPEAYFPTALYPTPIPAYIQRHMGPKPFIEVALMRRRVQEENIDTIRYAKILIQEFNLKLDRAFILSLNDIIGQSSPLDTESFQLQKDLCLARQSLKEATAILIASRPQKIYFEYIHLSPLKLHLSFSLHDKAISSSLSPLQTSSFKSDIVDFFLNSVGVTLTEIKNVELRMAYFERKGMLLTSSQLLAQVQSHYFHQTLQQAYVLILGLDVLGNPYGLVKDFTQGLGDFFYEPFLGSIQGKDEFADGLARGVHSLMGNVVGGTAGSVAGIAGGIGRTLAALSFDEDYKRKRRLTLGQEPTGLPASLALATKTLVIGVGLGLSGVVLDPIKGAHEDGVEGFFKGVGKGILGLLTKPSGGFFDMVNMAFDGLRRVAEMEGGVVARMRLPRYINPHFGLQPYSPLKASGQRLLQSVLKGDLTKTDIYWAHAPLSREEKSAVLLITDKNLLFLEKCRFWGGWDVDWKVSLDRILGVPAIKGEKMIFKIKEDDSGVNLFSSGEKEIVSKDTDILEWLQGQISKVIKCKVE